MGELRVSPPSGVSDGWSCKASEKVTFCQINSRQPSGICCHIRGPPMRVKAAMMPENRSHRR